ncbi:MAG TPA: hypothetical protein VGW11_11130 [Solirubrobacteraceae bacterium]|nr:hypothetical protein [Solirubrobacteraceae bacterium]
MDHGSEQRETEPRRDITGPDVPTGEATRPPGNGTTDEEAVRAGEERLDQASGSH